MDRKLLLTDLQRLVKDLVEDLHLRLGEDATSDKVVRDEFEQAKRAGRTSQGWEAFAEDYLTQVAVAWVLSAVFVRFVEDNQLGAEPFLAGHGRGMRQANDRYTAWISQYPSATDRDYLLHVFEQVGRLPGLRDLLGPDGHSYVWTIGPTADGARALREFWKKTEGEGLRHDFRDPSWDTRFLGDLYQDLSEHAQKKYALLQTPEFVEEFLLDKTLEPALQEFGLAQTTLIDPACGSGHFLLGAFRRLFGRWQQKEPGTAPQVLAQRALDAVAGVDLNPFAVAIARFRLLLAALQASGVTRLQDAFDFKLRVATGDSLLHGRHQGARQRTLGGGVGAEFDFDHCYASEDQGLLREIFGRSYHAVVGNPPYIVARDKALNELYRQRWPDVCHGKYSLGAPFTQLFFELARPKVDERRAPGFVGMITANSFMKREFGKKLIQEYLSGKVELTGVLDLSGAYIPGHGTPTVILLGRTRAAVGTTIRAVLGIKGEPSTPNDPARGVVWSAIVEQFEMPGSESDYISCADVPRERFAAHPWSIGGGGASEIKEQIEGVSETCLRDVAESVGITAFTLEDDLYLIPSDACRRQRIERTCVRPMLVGDEIRDWNSCAQQLCIFPYDGNFDVVDVAEYSGAHRYLWRARACIANNKMFGGKTKVEAGLKWWEFGRLTAAKLRIPLSITFAFVATHNHFVLDRGGKVFKQSAPVIKLRAGATEEEHLGLLGLLNSSVACFWLKQVSHNKGDSTDSAGARTTGDPAFNSYEFMGTAVGRVPLPEGRPIARGALLDRLGSRLGGMVAEIDPKSTLSIQGYDAEFRQTLRHLIALQEELDWECYRLYGLLQDDLTYTGKDLPGLALGQRAFEIVLARQIAAGKTTSTWFERHGSTPITEIPSHWPAAYRALVQRRIDCIEQNPDIRLIEQPEYKRRWNVEPFADQLARAQRTWLLDRMEDAKFWPEPKLQSTAALADLLRRDPEFVQVANLYRGSDHYDFDALVRELVEAESVPFLPVLRYKPTGLRKRAAWERTWDLQRREDAGEQVGPIDPPPKYTSADFVKSSYWSLRGKLDVPKERFIAYPYAERNDDPSPVITWAGFDHLQQAKALASYLLERHEQDGWDAPKLVPLYAGLRELLPWLRQWHNEIDPESQQRLGDYFAGFLAGQLQARGLSEADLTAWTPPARGRGRGKKRAAVEPPAGGEE